MRRELFQFGRNRLAPYIRVIGVVVRDLMHQFRRSALFILVTGTLGFLFELGSLLLILRYAILLEESGSARVLGFDYPARESTGLLLLVASAVLTLLLLAALFRFLSGRSIVLLRARYEQFAGNRALRHLNRLRCVTPVGNGPYLHDSDLMKILRRDTRFGGRIANMLIGSVLQVVIGLSMFAWLLWVNTTLTVVLILLVIPTGIMLYRSNVKGARASRAMEERSPQAAKAFRETLKRLRGSPAPLPDDSDWFDRHLFERDSVRRLVNAYTTRLMATPNAAVLTNLLFAVAISAMMLVFGWNILQQGEGWSTLIAYLIGLRFFLDSIRQVSARLTSINRFFPQLSRYSRFIHSAEPGTTLPAGSSVTIRCSPVDDLLPGSLPSCALNRGTPGCILAPVDLNRYTSAWMLQALLGRSRGARAATDSWFIAPDFGWIDGATLKDGLGLLGLDDVDRFLQALKRFQIEPEVLQQMESSIDEPLNAETWGALPKQVRTRLSIARAAVEYSTWLLLDGPSVQALAPAEQDDVSAMFGDRLLLHVYTQTHAVLSRPSDTVVFVLDDRRLCGIGPVQWLRANEQEMQEVLPLQAAPGECGEDDQHGEELPL